MRRRRAVALVDEVSVGLKFSTIAEGLMTLFLSVISMVLSIFEIHAKYCHLNIKQAYALIFIIKLYINA